MARAEAAPFVVVADRDDAPSLGPAALIDAPRRHPRVVIALRADGAGFERRFEHQIGEQADDRFGLRHFDVTTGGVALSREERRDCSQSQHPACRVIGMNGAGARRHPAFGEVPEVSHSGGGAAIGAETDPVFPRTARAHHLTRGEDDARVDFAELFEAQAVFFHRAGGAVLDDDIGVGGESHDDVAAAIGAEIDAQAAFASAGRSERRVHLGAVDRADEVRVRARFDLDDVGAVFGEQAAGFDADAADAEVEDAQAGERTSALRRVWGRRGLRDRE